MGTILDQCYRCNNWGPSWHKYHNCPKFLNKLEFDRLSYSQEYYDANELAESPAHGIEQLNFQQYLAHCEEVKEGYKSQLR
jgi:hypothetical protein